MKQHYPLPNINDQLDRLGGQVYFTSLDLSSGSSTDGVYCFKRMSFGLCNAPSVFQRLINVVLSNLRHDTAMAYLDDIIIPSKTIDKGLVKLREIFDRFRHANLTLMLNKCCFFMKTIKYLGFTISEKGISPGERKLRTIIEYPVPTDIHKAD